MADGWRARPDSDDPHTWHVEASGDDDGATGPHRPVLAALDDRGRVWLWIDGRTHVVAPPAARTRRSGRGRSADALSSPMPATVVGVAASVGDEVATGDTLLLLEAMKMEVPLRAPHAGRVTAVHCAVGDLVQPGTPLVEIEEEPAT